MTRSVDVRRPLLLPLLLLLSCASAQDTSEAWVAHQPTKHQVDLPLDWSGDLASCVPQGEELKEKPSSVVVVAWVGSAARLQARCADGRALTWSCLEGRCFLEVERGLDFAALAPLEEASRALDLTQGWLRVDGTFMPNDDADRAREARIVRDLVARALLILDELPSLIEVKGAPTTREVPWDWDEYSRGGAHRRAFEVGERRYALDWMCECDTCERRLSFEAPGLALTFSAGHHGSDLYAFRGGLLAAHVHKPLEDGPRVRYVRAYPFHD